MSTAVQFRRGTTAQHASFTGAVGEVTVDTDKKTVVVHDGASAGGHPLAKTNIEQTFTAAQTFNAAVDLGSRYAQTIVAVSALDINCSTGNFFTKTISANSTFTFSNVPTSRAYSFTLRLTHTSGTVTWPTSVKWPGDTAPTLATGKKHLFMFVTDDGGTVWSGAALADYP
jgi:hypothetical protein